MPVRQQPFGMTGEGACQVRNGSVTLAPLAVALVFGSVSQAVLHSPPLPVTIVKHNARDLGEATAAVPTPDQSTPPFQCDPSRGSRR